MWKRTVQKYGYPENKDDLFIKKKFPDRLQTHLRRISNYEYQVLTSKKPLLIKIKGKPGKV